jgi:hypothetical protein
VIELLRLDPQKFLSLHYNRSTIHPENDEDLALFDVEQLYGKMLENITNNVVTSLSDNILSISAFAQNRLFRERAFHPNFDATKNDLNNSNNALYNTTVTQLQDDGNVTDVSK